MVLSTTQNEINYQRIEEAINFLHENFHRQPDLNEVAERVHLSPFHFQRMFTEWAGISPKKFLQYLTADYLKQKLHSTRTIEEAANVAGLSSQSRVYDLFTTLEAVTPAEYRLNGAGLIIRYGFHDTPYGECLLGITHRGVCWMSFAGMDGLDAELEAMKRFWHMSSFEADQMATGEIIEKAFDSRSTRRLPLFVRGTNFQIKVWEALLRIPHGTVVTYQEVARQIGQPKAMQAVGSAVGANNIAYLIPCHRVIRRDGILGEYRWSAGRKKCMIGREMAHNDMANNH